MEPLYNWKRRQVLAPHVVSIIFLQFLLLDLFPKFCTLSSLSCLRRTLAIFITFISCTRSELG